MQFGCLVPQGWRLDLMGVTGDRNKWETCDRVARGLDAAGWESLWVYDHFHTVPRKEIEATFEAWTLMTHLASATSRARIGQLVTCNEYRHPAHLAKIAACVDVMSGGRLELGLGAGWYQEEFDAYGYEFRPIGERLGRLRESLEVIRAMWSNEKASYEGRHFRLKDAVCQPQPLQKPHPPIVIGGRGEKVLLRLVARFADVWNYNGNRDEFARYRDILKEHCRVVGRDFDEIRITAMAGGICYDSEQEKEAFLESIAAQKLPAERLFGFVSCKGSREECAEFLDGYGKLGVSGVVFYFNDIASFGSGRSQAEKFQRDVFPLL
ncbi:MAG TPA: LLM class F420-dependent oxidoreductase [Candidatus Binatia bacterium]|jgi:F420-dependent oxidoreductase-like protein